MARTPPRRSRGYRVFPHTADVGLALSGPTLAALYRNALQGLLSVLGLSMPPASRVARTKRAKEGSSRGGSSPAPVRISLHADSPETLLVDWLNELIYRICSAGRIPEAVRVLAGAPDRLKAELRERALKPGETLRTEVKSATYHGLAVRRRGGRWTARVILDI